jgi:hypothetical protein
MPKFNAKHLVAAAHRWLALAVVAVGAAAALSLGSVWRQLGHEWQAALAARQGLEPARLAALVQGSLAAHRGAAAAVLAGQSSEESERRRRQVAAEDKMVALALALEQRRLARALTESDQLRRDWQALLADIDSRRLTPADSDTQHELLIEQTFVVADLAATDSRLHSQAGRAFDAQAFALATRELPRLTAHAPPPAMLERRIERALARVLASNAHGDLDLGELQALLTLQQLLRKAPASDASAAAPAGAAGPEPALRALRLSQAAQQAWAALLARIDRDLSLAADGLAAQRRLVGFVLALDVLLVSLAATLVAVRRRRGSAPAHEAAPAAPAAALAGASPTGHAAADPGAPARNAESEAPAHALIDRLRKPAIDADTAGGPLTQR